MSIGRFCVRNVVTVHPSASVEVAAERMAGENVGALVVVEEDGKPVGIVTDRDLVVRVLAKNRPPHETEIRHVMTPNPVCIAEQAPLEGAMERMKFHRVRRLIVLDEAQKVTGIISLDDILELLAEEREALETVTSVMRAVRHEKL